MVPFNLILRFHNQKGRQKAHAWCPMVGLVLPRVGEWLYTFDFPAAWDHELTDPPKKVAVAEVRHSPRRDVEDPPLEPSASVFVDLPDPGLEWRDALREMGDAPWTVRDEPYFT